MNHFSFREKKETYASYIMWMIINLVGHPLYSEVRHNPYRTKLTTTTPKASSAPPPP
jgi:hypothetical protein